LKKLIATPQIAKPDKKFYMPQVPKKVKAGLYFVDFLRFIC
jgi:hypothetical protein